MTLSGPGAREGEQVFGVAHIFASFNDTFVVCMYNKLFLVMRGCPTPSLETRLTLPLVLFVFG